MSEYRVVDKLPNFTKSLYGTLSDAFMEACKDIVISSRTNAPFRKGGLRNEKNPITKLNPLHYHVNYTIEYAAYQEFGQRADGSHKVRHYTTPGTGPHFLKNAGDAEVKKLKTIVRKHVARARA